MYPKNISLQEFAYQEDRWYDVPFVQVTCGMLESLAAAIGECLRHVVLSVFSGATGQRNVHGEAVQGLDLHAHELLVRYCDEAGIFWGLVSEESEQVLFFDKDAPYVMVVDPLDGSSNIGVNQSVGTIFTVYKAQYFDQRDFLQPLSQQLFSGYVLYGTSTMLVCVSHQGVVGFTFDWNHNRFVLTHPCLRIPSEGQFYSCNEARLSAWSPFIQKFLEDLKTRNYSLRYAGAMVADIHRILFYGGVFLYPPDSKAPHGKLRVLYEIAPMSFLIEQAGGVALSHSRVMDMLPQDIHQCAPFYCGSSSLMKVLLQYSTEDSHPNTTT